MFFMPWAGQGVDLAGFYNPLRELDRARDPKGKERSE